MFKNNNDAEYYEGKRKGKDTCDAFLCAFVSLFYILSLSLSLAVWQSGLASGREDHLKKKKKRKMEENERKKTKKQKKSEEKGGDPLQRLGSFLFFFFLEISPFPLTRSVFPTKKRKGKGAQRTAAETIYIYI